MPETLHTSLYFMHAKYLFATQSDAMFRFAFFTLALFASANSQATIYKCMIDGVATFTEQPCGKDAVIVKIAPPPATNQPPATEQPEKPQKPADLSVEDYLKIQKADREIDRLQLEIKELQKQQSERIGKLNNMTQDAANRLGAPSIEDAISKQSERINAYYKSQITILEKQVAQLEEGKKQLTEQNSQSN
ncbi:hypothetical protein GCM10008027_34050 [Pseudoalteromonas gelatinilytica]|uniref:DUF4124 domain-containing protein n=2 Tax=Pseudoalteromonas gelatinilytica TaxID=1703256 RepID=A0ABQ1TXN4_9GAMM|nr:hypothetical protein GCM10008027_34050 [Pseudoalteromonas profundi]